MQRGKRWLESVKPQALKHLNQIRNRCPGTRNRIQILLFNVKISRVLYAHDGRAAQVHNLDAHQLVALGFEAPDDLCHLLSYPCVEVLKARAILTWPRYTMNKTDVYYDYKPLFRAYHASLNAIGLNHDK
jgi:hypothetical protein